MYLIALYIAGFIWAQVYGYAVALIALPFLGTGDEDKEPSPIALAILTLADKYLFLTWPAIVVVVSIVQLADWEGGWVLFGCLGSLYIAIAPAKMMTAGEQDPMIKVRALSWALGATLVFAFWPMPIFYLYPWLVKLMEALLG